MEKNPLVTIIIVSFNTKRLLLDCIASVSEWVDASHEIIIVDNNSHDGSVTSVKKLKRKNIKVIENNENVGFAKANNQAMEIAKGAYILLLNSDTYLTTDCVSACINKLKSNPKIGVISCQLKNADGSLQPTGGYFPTPLRLYTWMLFLDHLPFIASFIKPFHPSPSFYKHNQELDWVTGAFFMLPRSVVQEVGVMDEDYFMYVEEMDWCYRIKKQKLKVYYLHDTSVVHLGRASSTNEFAIVSELRHIMLFYKKHLSLWVLYSKLVIRTGVTLRVIFFGILGKREQRIIYEKTLKSF